ncbi:putative sulfate exporter family transporter [Chryseobacterium sp. POL2]|uniref:YeiH family protein n=1 Tax=Chryseobacterium sp. POL2 TaxID=2713414 RepID=UPI0013E14599|nr:putative sulfate exporter family transporter [Chryseobacterium sp. POL2]QIG90905.1 putative sulfate exporter family transporter [Chryseobacterium sp. POL2]
MGFLTSNKNIQILIFSVLAILSFSGLVSSPIALLLGLFFAILVGNPFENKVSKYISKLLQISIVGLGFGLHLDEALQVGQSGFLLTVGSIFSVLILGYFLGQLLNIERPLSYLISAGTAICGGSAIAAVSPIIKANTKQISLALAIVFSLNSVALFVYPSIGHWLMMSQQDFGMWCAIGIHDTSSVVGAASKYGDEALKTATTVKLARALWIIPVSILTMFIFKTKDSKIKIPWFIGFFIIAILLSTYFPIFEVVSPTVTEISKLGLNLTLFLIGSTLSLEALRSISIKPLFLAIFLWIFISIGSLILILN